MPVGCRIFQAVDKVAAEIVDRFKDLPVANVSDVMTRLTGTSRLRPMHAGGWLGGPALTVKTRPGDNLLVHKAIDIAEPGDVIVVDAGGTLDNAIIGELMAAHAEQKRIAGFVIDGAIRDAGTLGKRSFPVFAAGVSHRGPYKDGPGEINVTISIDGMVVSPGDLILGDADGLVCLLPNDIEAVLRDAEAKKAAEEIALQRILSGTMDRSWVDTALSKIGCETLPKEWRS